VLLSRSWHAVVGNPPYITVKDPALRELYRKRFTTSYRQYSLAVPFTERFFQLARSEADPERAGYIGMITANSFMKREFGRKLVEEWVPTHDLTHVIDTSVVSVPHHGTPTVMLLGRNRYPVATTVRAVLGIKRNIDDRLNPEKGLVWLSIVRLTDEPGTANEYVSVVDLDRSRLARHPWSIGGGGAAELKELLDRRGSTELGSVVGEIGFGAMTREDDAFCVGHGPAQRAGVSSRHRRPLVAGEEIRDWRVTELTASIWPYEAESLGAESEPAVERFLWPWRAQLSERVAYGKTQLERGLEWWEYSMFFRERFRTPLSIVFASVATHNHFVLDRGGKVFKQSAPVIKLSPVADERRHLSLLGVLNSSTACFWMKQVFHNKGSQGVQEGIKAEAWERFFDHDGTKLKEFPLPYDLNTTTACLLDRLAMDLASVTPAAVAASTVPSVGRLAEAACRDNDLREQMIAVQEHLDWEVYRRYGLIGEDLTTDDDPEPPLRLGERAFEIVLARRMAAGEENTTWFARHGATAITKLPAHWPEPYKRLVQRRIDLIESDLNIGLIERPEHKRRWLAKPWDEQVKVALRGWLLNRLELPRYWPEPAALTSTARLAAEARTDAGFVQVAQLYAGRDDVDIAALVAELVKAEAVPYLAALRYTDSGMRKHVQWLATWELQRREDAGEDVGAIPVPPKYAKADFQEVAWDYRGKLDVPKERFISYPGAERETDSSLVIGWAGWDHLARARALATWYLQARRDGRDREHLRPLLAGLAELVPWLRQWYDDPDPDPALDRPGSQIAALVNAEMRALHLTADDLAGWRPAPTRRGRTRR
jgi:hypothetical protein